MLELPIRDYFRDNVLVKRPYIQREWCETAVCDPIRREVQADDGRIRHWIWIDALDRYLRVVTLADGQTIHNAFPDRRFRP
ncbi:hypothetical protein [Thiorhodovibrio frisius]|uniref:Uncharacterized protein n=1 Tax=Thiorhodovibrio frisius TaxID=631362 RepID=H8Z596_9GAMM|nr:hypothetical protein [Thiorhodovibrio frisius]EIC20503.1 hypothetical protein Thi970DRAFT_04142 [Thiorhodovibrio frisius]WPL21245.1 hypothetical protein Thiofri_01357 [Thiorhodovibrio frisius]